MTVNIDELKARLDALRMNPFEHATEDEIAAADAEEATLEAELARYAESTGE